MRLLIIFTLIAIMVRDCFTSTIWNVTVFTGNAEQAGTENDFKIQIFGEKGYTNAMNLNQPTQFFLNNAIDEFTFSTDDIGFPASIRVFSTDTESEDGWQLNKIEINYSGGVKMIRYSYYNWLSSDTTWDALIHGHVVDTRWSVRVFTSKEENAGSNASAWLQIFGRNGITEKLNIDPLHNETPSGIERYVQNEMVEFNHLTIDVGFPSYIKVWVTSGDASSNDWHLQKVELKESGSDKWIVYPINKRLTYGKTFEESYALSFAEGGEGEKEEGKEEEKEEGEAAALSTLNLVLIIALALVVLLVFIAVAAFSFFKLREKKARQNIADDGQMMEPIMPQPAEDKPQQPEPDESVVLSQQSEATGQSSWFWPFGAQSTTDEISTHSNM